jgi:methylenetetrahydrofolate reductase (NADPH)
MRIDEILASSTEPVFSFEFFPPRTEEGARNLNRALEELKPLAPDFVSVTYGAGGSTREKTIGIVKRIREQFGLEAMAHFTCVAATVEELRATLDEMRDAGIDNVLALRGDPPEGQDQWTKTEGGLEYSHELVSMIASDYDFAIGGACFPETHIHAVDAESDLRFLKDKVDAGARFLITQLFFDNAFYEDFVRRARAIGITVPIIAGIWPITSVGQIERVTALCGSELPAPLLAELHARADEPEAVLEFGVATPRCSAPTCWPRARREFTSTH